MRARTRPWLFTAAVVLGVTGAGIDLGTVIAGGTLDRGEQLTALSCMIVWIILAWTWFRRSQR